MKRKTEIGDIIEIKTKHGMAYAQISGSSEKFVPRNTLKILLSIGGLYFCPKAQDINEWA